MMLLVLALLGPIVQPKPMPKPKLESIKWAKSSELIWLPTRYSGYDCPVHGPLFNSDFTGYDAWTIVGPNGCPRRMVCTKCLLKLVETPNSCLPELIDVREK